MQVRIRLGRGSVVTRRKGKNSQIAQLAASVLTLGSISFAIFAFWRLGMDLGFTASFVFTSGLLSHWQVWMGAAIATQYVCWRLGRYARQGVMLADSFAMDVDEAQRPAEARVALNA